MRRPRVRGLIGRVAVAYGANPARVLAPLTCFALTGYVCTHIAGDPLLARMAVWFGAAIVAHDLVLFPLSGLADRTWLAMVRAGRRVRAFQLVSPVNHLRVPVLGSGLLLLMFLPGIIRQGRHFYLAATGQTQQPFLVRWLLITAVLFAVSAVGYVVRLRLAGRRR